MVKAKGLRKRTCEDKLTSPFSVMQLITGSSSGMVMLPVDRLQRPTSEQRKCCKHRCCCCLYTRLQLTDGRRQSLFACHHHNQLAAECRRLFPRQIRPRPLLQVHLRLAANCVNIAKCRRSVGRLLYRFWHRHRNLQKPAGRKSFRNRLKLRTSVRRCRSRRRSRN